VRKGKRDDQASGEKRKRGNLASGERRKRTIKVQVRKGKR
jgi:hypothetical protein